MSFKATKTILDAINNRRKTANLSTIPDEFNLRPCKTIDMKYSKKDDTVVSVISTILPDRDREVLLPRGCDLSEFVKSPTVLFGHEYSGTIFGTDTISVIGKNLWTKIDDVGIIAKTKFANTDFAQQCKELVMDEVLRMWSVGFIPEEYHGISEDDLKENPEWEDKVFYVIDKWTMLEYSLVPIGSNPGALTLTAKYNDYNETLLKTIKSTVTKPEETIKKETTTEELTTEELDDLYTSYASVDTGWDSSEVIPEHVLERIEEESIKDASTIENNSQKEKQSDTSIETADDANITTLGWDDADKSNYVFTVSEEEFSTLSTRTLKKDEPVVKGKLGSLRGSDTKQWKSFIFPKADANDNGWTFVGAKDWLEDNKESLLSKSVDTEPITPHMDMKDVQINIFREEAQEEVQSIVETNQANQPSDKKEKEVVILKSDIMRDVKKTLSNPDMIALIKKSLGNEVKETIKDEIYLKTGKH